MVFRNEGTHWRGSRQAGWSWRNGRRWWPWCVPLTGRLRAKGRSKPWPKVGRKKRSRPSRKPKPRSDAQPYPYTPATRKRSIPSVCESGRREPALLECEGRAADTAFTASCVSTSLGFPKLHASFTVMVVWKWYAALRAGSRGWCGPSTNT